MQIIEKITNTPFARNATSLWRLTKVVNSLDLSVREKFFGRLEIAYRILRLTTNVLAIRRIERNINRQKTNLMLYNIGLDEELESEESDHCHCDKCVEQEKQFLADNLPVHEN